jgi:NDP-sugar pyrophosphorylase family protein
MAELKKNLILVYMVAGISSRFGGKIKQFAKVGPNNETLIEVSLNQALKAGFNKIVFIVGNKTFRPFKEKFGNSFNGIPIEYAMQTFSEKERDKPWGTCDAICCAKKLLDAPFVICNGDDLYGEKSFKSLVQHLTNDNDEATVAWSLRHVIPQTGAVSRGILSTKEGNVQSIKETHGIEKNNLPSHITEDSLCNMNLFVLHPETLDLLEEALINFKKIHKGDRKSECYLPVELSNLFKIKKIKMKVFIADEPWMGITNPSDELSVRESLKSYKI